MSNYIGSINAKNIDGKNIININTEITNIKGRLVANDASFSNLDISENIIVNGDISCNGLIRGDGRYLNGVLRYPDQSTKKGNFLTNDGTNLIWSNDVCFNTLTINNHLDVCGNQYLNGSLDMNNQPNIAYIKLNTNNTIPTNTENPNNSILSLIKVKTKRNYIMWNLSDDIMRIGRLRAGEEPAHLREEYGSGDGTTTPGFRIGDLGDPDGNLGDKVWEKPLNIHQQENIGFDINTGIFKIIDSGIYNIIFNCTIEISLAHGVVLGGGAHGTAAVAARSNDLNPVNRLASVRKVAQQGHALDEVTSQTGSGDHIGWGGAHTFSQRGESKIEIGIDIHKNGKTTRYIPDNNENHVQNGADEDYVRVIQYGQMARNDFRPAERSNFTHIAIDTYMELPENSLIMFKFFRSETDGISSISKYTHGSICRIGV